MMIRKKKYKDVIKKTYVFQTSKYLFIQLKRWNMNLRKNQRVIHYDVNEPISLAKYYYDKNRAAFQKSMNFLARLIILEIFMVVITHALLKTEMVNGMIIMTL